MMRITRTSLFLMAILIAVNCLGQKKIEDLSEKQLNQAIIDFDKASNADPNKSSILLARLAGVSRNGNLLQKQKVELLFCEQKNREGNLSEFIVGMNSLIRQNPGFSQPILKHYYAINFTKFCLYKNALSQAFDSNLKNIAEAKKTMINRNISQAYQNHAHYFRINNTKDSSLYYARLATKYAKRSDARNELALSFHYESQIHAHFGEIEMAVEKELIALQLAEKYNLIYLQSLFSRTIASYSLEVFNIKESNNYLRKAILLASRINDERSILLCEITKGCVLVNDNKHQEAIAILTVGIKKLEKYKDAEQIVLGHEYLGKAFEKINEEAEALNSFSLALNYYEAIGNRDKISDLNHQIGVVYLKQKSFFLSEKFLTKAIEIRNSEGEKNQIYETYRVLSDLYTQTGKKDAAFLYLKKYVDFLELNSTSKNSQKIAALTQKNSGEERERIIEMQGETLEKELKEKKILQLQSDRRFFGIIFTVIILLLSLFIVFIFLRQNKLKQDQRVTEMSQSLLRSQMNPHFIFNAMSVIQSYIYSNTPDLASKFLVNFSRLIRLILENSHKEFIPLEIEEEILTKYLNTQKLRFENRFNFKIKIARELRINRLLIPPMITQPFIENAIEHGQLHTIPQGLITIFMEQQDNLLTITISDNGVGRTKSGKIKKNKSHKSMAINITSERIKIINKKFKGRGSLAINDLNFEEKTGTHVKICLPIIYENPNFLAE